MYPRLMKVYSVSLLWLVLAGSLFKGMPNGRIAETDMFRYAVSLYAARVKWTPSETAGDALTGGCWTLRHCPCCVVRSHFSNSMIDL